MKNETITELEGEEKSRREQRSQIMRAALHLVGIIWLQSWLNKAIWKTATGDITNRHKLHNLRQEDKSKNIDRTHNPEDAHRTMIECQHRGGITLFILLIAFVSATIFFVTSRATPEGSFEKIDSSVTKLHYVTGCVATVLLAITLRQGLEWKKSFLGKASELVALEWGSAREKLFDCGFIDEFVRYIQDKGLNYPNIPEEFIARSATGRYDLTDKIMVRRVMLLMVIRAARDKLLSENQLEPQTRQQAQKVSDAFDDILFLTPIFWPNRTTPEIRKRAIGQAQVELDETNEEGPPLAFFA